eukprot:764782-Hanusia_phi.AAC.9
MGHASNELMCFRRRAAIEVRTSAQVLSCTNRLLVCRSDSRYCMMSPGFVLKSLLHAFIEDCDYESVCSTKHAAVCEEAMKSEGEEDATKREDYLSAIRHVLSSKRLVLFIAHDLSRIVQAG